LVEALEKIAMDETDYPRHEAKQALANHAKRMRGEE